MKGEIGLYLHKMDFSINSKSNNELFIELNSTLDEIEKQEIFEQIMRNNMPLINNAIKRILGNPLHFCNKWRITYDDLFSVGTMGLCKAIKKYKYGEINPFYPFAKICVENEIKMFLRYTNRGSKPVSLNEIALMNAKSENKYTYEECIKDEEIIGMFDSILDKEFIKAILEKTKKLLTEREYEVFKLYYIDNINMEEIGIQFNVTRFTISKWIKKIKEKLYDRKEMFA